MRCKLCEEPFHPAESVQNLHIECLDTLLVTIAKLQETLETAARLNEALANEVNRLRIENQDIKIYNLSKTFH